MRLVSGCLQRRFVDRVEQIALVRINRSYARTVLVVINAFRLLLTETYAPLLGFRRGIRLNAIAMTHHKLFLSGLLILTV